MVTHDTDFGELIFHRQLRAECGVILLRLTSANEQQTARLLEVLELHDDWDDYFTTVSEERVRRRRLPR